MVDMSNYTLLNFLISIVLFAGGMYLSIQSIRHYKIFEEEARLFFEKNKDPGISDTVRTNWTASMFYMGIILGFCLCMISIVIFTAQLMYILIMPKDIGIIILSFFVFYVTVLVLESKKMGKKIKESGIKEFKYVW